MTDICRVEHLTVRYGERIGIAGVDLRVPSGATVAVIGPNGSGKSTLLAAIAGLVPPASGSITVDRSRLAFVLQSTEVDEALPITVLETVRMARYPHRGMFGRLRAADHLAVTSAMERTEVLDLAHRQLRGLSGGQRQRVLLAQGLAQGADLLLLDEPATGLDLTARELVLDVVARERAAGRSVVMTTHSLDDAARCDLVLLLATRPIALGAPEEVIADEHLATAFGGRVLRLPTGELLLDDPHHRH